MLIPVVIVLAGCGGEQSNAAEGQFDWPEHLSPLQPEYVMREAAPDFALPTLTVTELGEDTVRLHELRGHVVYLNFWNTTCRPCVAEHTTLNRVADAFADEPVRFLGINNLDTPASLGAFEDQHGETRYPHLADRGGRVGQEYEQRGWPLHVVIDREGKVAWWRPSGPIKEETLTEVLSAVLDGRRPESRTSAVYIGEVGP